jgi:predicted RNA-binding Zn ribbon-like protein
MADQRPNQLALIGGALALDFCNTVDWRVTADPVDRLGDYAGWLEWCEHVGCMPSDVVCVLTGEARRRPRDAARAFDRVIDLRSRVGAVFDRLADGLTPEAGDLDAIRAAYTDALGSARLQVGALQWPPSTDLDCPLWPVLHDGWTLLLASPAPRIRVCEGAGCGWVFLDGTRNASRRWCSSESCGRRERVRRHRARHRALAERQLRQVRDQSPPPTV